MMKKGQEAMTSKTLANWVQKDRMNIRCIHGGRRIHIFCKGIKWRSLDMFCQEKFLFLSILCLFKPETVSHILSIFFDKQLINFHFLLRFGWLSWGQHLRFWRFLSFFWLPFLFCFDKRTIDFVFESFHLCISWHVNIPPLHFWNLISALSLCFFFDWLIFFYLILFAFLIFLLLPTFFWSQKSKSEKLKNLCRSEARTSRSKISLKILMIKSTFFKCYGAWLNLFEGFKL